MGSRKAVAAAEPEADGLAPVAAAAATADPAADGGAGEEGSECERDAAAATALMGDRLLPARAAAAAAPPSGAKEPGVGGTLSTHCGLTGRLWVRAEAVSGSALLARVERKGPGLMGRPSLAIVRLEAACRALQGGDGPGVLEESSAAPAMGVCGTDVAAGGETRTGGGARGCCCC